MMYTSFDEFKEYILEWNAHMFSKLLDDNTAILHPVEENTFLIPTNEYIDDFKGYLEKDEDVYEDELRESLCCIKDFLLFSDNGRAWHSFDEDGFENHVTNMFDKEFYMSSIDGENTICINEKVLNDILAKNYQLVKNISGASSLAYEFTYNDIRNFVFTIVPFEKIDCSENPIEAEDYSFLWKSDNRGLLNILDRKSFLTVLTNKEKEFIDILNNNSTEVLILEAQCYLVNLTLVYKLILQIDPFPKLNIWEMEPISIGYTLTLHMLYKVLNKYTNNTETKNIDAYLNLFEKELNECKDIDDKIKKADMFIQIFITNYLGEIKEEDRDDSGVGDEDDNVDTIFDDFKKFQEKIFELNLNMFKKLTKTNSAILHPMKKDLIFIPTEDYLDEYNEYYDDYLNNIEHLDDDELRENLCCIYDLLLFSKDGKEWKIYDEDDFEDFIDNMFEEEFFMSYINHSQKICINKKVINSIIADKQDIIKRILIDITKVTVKNTIRYFIDTIVPFEIKSKKDIPTGVTITDLW